MLTTWVSSPEGSARRAAITVRTVFRCVASRNRCRSARESWGFLRRKSNKTPGGPAPGYRHAFYGTLWNVGDIGYSWMCALAGDFSRFLDFNYVGINPNSHSYRANGLQLRCLQK